MKCFLIFLNAIMLGATSIFGQQISFKKFFNPDSGITSMRIFDGKQTVDGGYAFTGLANFGAAEKPVVAKIDCKGNTVWTKYFGNTSSWNNIFMKVINTADSGVLVMTNIGNFQAYNILLTKIDAKGNTQWKKIINNGQGNDMGQSIKTTKDGGYILCGATTSFGSDMGNSSYSDIYIVKLNAAGLIQFTRTIGQSARLDDAKDIVETAKGDFVFTGAVITKECFNIAVGKISNTGAVLWVKAFGDTLSRNGGYGLLENAEGDLFVFGTTTIHNPSPNFNDDISHALLRMDSNGVLKWQKVFNGSNNGSDNSLSICFSTDSNLVLGTETMSYPSTGFTPNKQVAHVFTRNGDLVSSIGYNTTGSQYTRVHQAGKGFTLSGFGTINSNINARPNFYKMDSVLQTSCSENDLTALTQFQVATFNDWTYIGGLGMGANIGNYNTENTFGINDTTLCENYPAINANYNVADTCFGLPIIFTAQNTNGLHYIWILGNGDTLVTTSNTLSYTYNASGNFTTQLFITNGCDTAMSTQSIVVKGNSNISIIPSIANPTLGQVVGLSVNTPASNYLWNDGSTSSTININAAGSYWISALVDGCPASDTIQITFGPATTKGSYYIPNAITPNNDDLNDDLEIITTGAYAFQRIRVYNRWGKMVFESTDPNKRFNGQVAGELGNMDTYYYYVVFKVLGVEEVVKGDVMVVR